MASDAFTRREIPYFTILNNPKEKKTVKNFIASWNQLRVMLYRGTCEAYGLDKAKKYIAAHLFFVVLPLAALLRRWSGLNKVSKEQEITKKTIIKSELSCPNMDTVSSLNEDKGEPMAFCCKWFRPRGSGVPTDNDESQQWKELPSSKN
ncbi:hypothetical protein Ciccas_014425 [Cichlidogyrus casuarinus]|uniref:Uncharacterized protein n=1 Tax=Cichlidogyrus casuarinus TaxID=1844966 RepID=A0ABD2PIA2_9PLAT